VPGDHRKGQPAVVADIRPRFQRIEQVRHHRRSPQLLAASMIRAAWRGAPGPFSRRTHRCLLGKYQI
jgi:hypothetical protein